MSAMSQTSEETRAESPPTEVYAQLEEAFRVFNDVSASFTEQYSKLEQRIKELNVELEDANEQLRANLEERRRMEEYLSTLLESLPTGVIGLSAAARVHSLNRAACQILLRDDLEMDGLEAELDLEDLFGPLEDDSREILGEIRDAIAEGGRPEVTFELSLGRGDECRPRVIRLQVAPTRGREREGGQEANAVLLVEDVTDIRRLQQQANRNDRLMAMGEIAMNVAHEIRNPLGSIELFASMLQRELAGDETNGPLAEHICTGVRCLDHIVMNILQFSRPQRLSRSACDLRDILDETIVYCEHALR
ncbi:MAG: histidine kinase dimerization/phospho-acceptor domain-containing protein, partial [Candidatus Sumerlaeota bacterium]